MGKRSRESCERDELEHSDIKRRKREHIISPIKHNVRTPKEPGYYRTFSVYGHQRDSDDQIIKNKQAHNQGKKRQIRPKKLQLGFQNSSHSRADESRSLNSNDDEDMPSGEFEQ